MLRLLLLCALAFCLCSSSAQAAIYAPGMQAENQIQSHDPLVRKEAWDILQTNGTKVLRVSLLWSQITATCTLSSKQNDACYRWQKYDQIVQEAQDHHIQLMFSIYTAPGWANKDTGSVSVGQTSEIFNQFVMHYTDFSKLAVMRYPSVKLWTIWNEPNGGVFFQPMTASAPHRYAVMFTSAARAMKQAHPEIKIAIGPTAPSAAGGIKPRIYWPVLQKELTKLKAGTYIDAVAHNPYPTANRDPYVQKAGDSLGLAKMGELIRILDQSSVTRGKPIWATEFAYETDAPSISEKNQAIYMAHVFRILAMTPRVKIALWYVLKDPTDQKDWQSGLYRSDGGQKLSAQMFARPIAVKKTKTQYLIWGRSHLSQTSYIMYSKNGVRWTRLTKRSISNKTIGFVRVQDPLGSGIAISLKEAL